MSTIMAMPTKVMIGCWTRTAPCAATRRVRRACAAWPHGATTCCAAACVRFSRFVVPLGSPLLLAHVYRGSLLSCNSCFHDKSPVVVAWHWPAHDRPTLYCISHANRLTVFFSLATEHVCIFPSASRSRLDPPRLVLPGRARRHRAVQGARVAARGRSRPRDRRVAQSVGRRGRSGVVLCTRDLHAANTI